MFTDNTTKVDSEPPNGLNDDITNPYECDQNLNVCAGTLNLIADLALELGKSISLTEAEEEAVAREVHATHARIVSESEPEPTQRRQSGIAFRDSFIVSKKRSSDSSKKLKGIQTLTPAKQEAADIMKALKESKKMSKRQPRTGGSNEGTGKAHEALAGPDPEPMKEDQTGSDSGKLHVSLAGPNPEHMDDEFLATAYPKVHENLKLITDERVIDDNPESHSGSMSSMKNLEDTDNFGDQFLYDKPTEDDQEKSKVVDESDSTIPDPSHQTVTSTPPVIAPFTEFSYPKPSSLVTPPPINTEATTITPSLPEITPFIALQLRVARLEQEMSEVKKTDHSADVLASIKSQVSTAVDKYLGTELDDALLKNQESEKSPKEIIRIKREQGEEKQDSTYSIRSTDKVDLEEFDLKSALFKHMNKNKSANRNPANYHLYHALMEALIADEDAMDKEVKDRVKNHKRKHDSDDDDEDDDDDEGPSAGSNQGKSTKRRRHDSGASGSAQPPTKDDEQSSKKPRKSDASASKQHPALPSTGWKITDTRDADVDSSMHRSDPESEQSEQSSDNIPMQDEGHVSDLEDTDNAHIPKVSTTTWFKPIPEGERPATPEPEWTIPPNDFPEPENNWANTYATTYQVPMENKLQRKTYDIGSFIKWFCRQTGKKKLCKADLEGPAFNLVKAFHKNNVFLQYSPKSRCIFIKTKHRYALETLKNMEDLTDPVDTPMVDRLKLDEDLLGITVDQTRFRGMVGSLMYLTSSRPDLMSENQEEVFRSAHYLEIDWLAGHQRSKEARPSQQQRRNTLQCLDVVLKSLKRSQLKDYGFLFNKIPLYCDNKSAIALSNQTNGIARTRDNIVTGQAEKKTKPEQEYILIPICTTNLLISQDPKVSKEDAEEKPTEMDESGASDKDGKDDQATRISTPVMLKLGSSLTNDIHRSSVNAVRSSSLMHLRNIYLKDFLLSKMHLHFHSCFK
ncbi:hypothetical protein Tco_1110377 [Tanacetum coccineum]|uniref:Reverse transcriptase Ty1/copia-type domain-containing protein n=1 Tax=Tanacetum coccineum TaxID=301880 RepID=A0ABQ5IIM7_9ASTR